MATVGVKGLRYKTEAKTMILSFKTKTLKIRFRDISRVETKTPRLKPRELPAPVWIIQNVRPV